MFRRWGRWWEIQLTYPKDRHRTWKDPKGTRVLFVNATRQMAREAITQLEQLGVEPVSMMIDLQWISNPGTECG